MKTIKVEEMFECPFKYEEEFRYSELTTGYDNKCTILKDDCRRDGCPLINENSIKVEWIGS